MERAELLTLMDLNWMEMVRDSHASRRAGGSWETEELVHVRQPSPATNRREHGESRGGSIARVRADTERCIPARGPAFS